MNINSIKQFVTSKTGRTVLKLRKQSPHILFATGVVGMVGVAVSASVATTKVEGVLEEHETRMEMITEARSKVDENSYSEKDAQRDRVIIYAQTGLRLARLYAPTVGLATLSIGCLAGSHKILNARNVALSGALTAVETAFEKYRSRVIEEFGVEKDREIRFASEKLEVIEETETGPQPKDLTRVDTSKPVAHPYARLWGPDNKNWERKPEYNVMFLRTAQNVANDRLRARGHIFLNEVFDLLGLEHTRTGAVCGWIANGQPGASGDGFVDFGIWDKENDWKFLDFVTGREGSILLDFNVDGSIWDKI